MSGSAAVAIAQLTAAVNKLRTAQLQVVSAKSHVTDIGISLNTGTTATTDAIGQQLNAITEVREAIWLVQQALVGSSAIAATEALVWLNKVDEDLVDDSAKLNAMKDAIAQVNLQVHEIVTNHEEGIKHLNGAISRLNAQISVIG